MKAIWFNGQRPSTAHWPRDNTLADHLGMELRDADELCRESVPRSVRKYGVGLEINANHVRPVHDGWVTGTARPVHLGATTQVWTCEIRDSCDRTVSTSRMTIAVLDRKPDAAALS